MGRAKEIIVKVIPAKIAVPFVKKHHYSGKVVQNSSLHFGAFLDGKLHGVLSYGPSLDKAKICALVEGTRWDGFLELNRMAFDDYLPKNSESFCIAKTIGLSRLRMGAAVAMAQSIVQVTSCSPTFERTTTFVCYHRARKSTK